MLRSDDAQAVVGGGWALEQRGDALVLELARGGGGERVLQRIEAVEEEEVTPLAHEAGKALSFLERAGATGGERLVRVVAEEDEGFLEEQVRARGQLLACALAVEGPCKDRIASRPVLMREVRRPLRYQRGLSLAPERDDGEDVGARGFDVANFVPGIGE